LEQEIALWDPNTNDDATTDPFKTLFVSRINFYTSESKLRREFETYGPIKQIKVVQDKKTGKPRGYCFIEFEQEKDMHCKYFGPHFHKKITNKMYGGRPGFQDGQSHLLHCPLKKSMKSAAAN
jgi:RNA recognition motif-containing protein